MKKQKKKQAPRSPLLTTIPMPCIIRKNKQPHQKAYQTNNWTEIKAGKTRRENQSEN